MRDIMWSRGLEGLRGYAPDLAVRRRNSTALAIRNITLVRHDAVVSHSIGHVDTAGDFEGKGRL